MRTPLDDWEIEGMAGSSRNIVNLDALLPRADLLTVTPAAIRKTQVIRIGDLEPSALYDMLRKPDFQRETANWSPLQVSKLIQTFCEQDIIPAMILWQSGGHIFVVDGAHRLSALVAWVRDDYGAGDLSQKLFQGIIPHHQRVMHEKTRELVNNSVGPWSAFRANNNVILWKDLDVQWIENQQPPQVAEAFIRINQGGTVIDPLEVRIVRAPRAALSVATRAITRGGIGHSYWQHFSDAVAKERTPKLGAEIYKLLFHPPLETPIKTMDVPLAGFEYNLGVVRLAFDLTALTNNIAVPDSTRRNVPVAKKPADDATGAETIKYLQNAKKAVQLILSNDKSSFGLHPALYFYTAGGSFQPSALLNMIAWVMDLEERNQLDTFRKARGAFETLLLMHPVIVKPATHKLGSGARTRKRMLGLFNRVLELLVENSGKGPKWAAGRTWLMLQKDFPHLKSDEKEQAEEAEAGEPGARFTSKSKSAASLEDLASIPRCGLCDGLMHRNGKVLDHVDKRADGGTSAKGNRRWVHPRCNSFRDKDEQNAKASR